MKLLEYLQTKSFKNSQLKRGWDLKHKKEAKKDE